MVLHSATEPRVLAFAEHLAERHGAHLTILPVGPQEPVLAAHARARASIGVSISDGVSASFLEALVHGSLPVQSRTATASEWVVDGVSALLVDPHDLAALAKTLERALTDDHLVDRAADINERIARDRLDHRVVSGAIAQGVAELLRSRRRDAA